MMSASHYSLHLIPEEERPRERLLRHGPEALTTADLIAIILGSGMKGMSILQIAQEVVIRFGNMQRLADASIEELCTIKGLGRTKALQLKAAFSLGLRLSKQAPTARYRIEHPQHAYYLIKDEIQNERRELFIVILQDAKGCVLCHEVVAIGTLSNALVHPREVFYPAIRHNAASFILVHNHPSGDPTPSPQDFEVTRSLIDASRLMGIPINDHIIVGNPRYVSLRQQGVIFE